MTNQFDPANVPNNPPASVGRASATHANGRDGNGHQAEDCSTEDMIILPSGKVTITQAAEKLFARIAPAKNLFQRGGLVVELRREDGQTILEILKPAAARSRFERYGRFHAYRVGQHGKTVLQPTIIPEDMARALLESEAARLLPEIAGLVNCPIITTTGEVFGKGYHPETKLLITAGGDVPHV